MFLPPGPAFSPPDRDSAFPPLRNLDKFFTFA